MCEGGAGWAVADPVSSTIDSVRSSRYGAQPYADVSSKNMLSHLHGGSRLHQPANCSDKAYSMMAKCWGRNRHTRWTFAGLHQEMQIELQSSQPLAEQRDIGASLHDVVRWGCRWERRGRGAGH